MTAPTDDTPADGFARICGLDDVPDGGSAAATVDGADGPRHLMVIRLGDNVWVYVNECPHVSLSLDFVPGRFLNRERTHILCANHGALFNIESGDCVLGPCRGQGLTPIQSAVRDGAVFVALEV